MLNRLRTQSREAVLCLGVLTLVAVAPAGSEATDPIVLGIYRTLLIAIVLGYCWGHGLTAHALSMTPLSRRFLAGLAVVAAAMALSAALPPGSSFEGTYVLYEKILFLAAFVALAHTASVRPLPWKHAILSGVVAIQSLYVLGALLIGKHPLYGPFVNPNYFASYLLPGVAICSAAVLLAARTAARAAAAAAGVLLYYGILQTTSRGATLAGLAILCLAGFRAAQRSGLRWRTLIGAGALGAVLIGAITMAANPALIRKFLDRGERDPYNYQRVQIWRGSLAMVREYPLAGVGIGRFDYMAKSFTPAVEGTIARYRKWPNIAHSEYLQYMAELGLPAALLLFSLAAWVLKLLWTRADGISEDALAREAGLLAAVALGTHALVDNNLTVPVMAVGMAVISQSDCLPRILGARAPLRWNRPAVGLALAAVWMSAAVIPAAGLYFNERGHAAYNAGRFDEAETLHRIALAIVPRHPVLLDNLGMVYFDRFLQARKPEDLDRAEALFRESMAENPRFDVPAGHLEAALIQRLTGDPALDRRTHEQIVEADWRVLENNPFNPFIRKNLAEALFNIGSKDEAFRELQKAVEIEPNYVPGYLRLAEWSGDAGREAESEGYRQQAIAVVLRYKDLRTADPFEDLLLGRAAPGSSALTADESGAPAR